MALTIRRLGPGDEPILARLAADEADFDLAGRGEPQQPLDPDVARRYLANPAVLHWVAFDTAPDTAPDASPDANAADTPASDYPVGDLYCLVVPLSADAGQELLLYDIGVRSAWRRRGVGRALLATMDAWMRDHRVADVWVLADNPGAVAFYRACGFAPEDEQPVYLTKSRES